MGEIKIGDVFTQNNARWVISFVPPICKSEWQQKPFEVQKFIDGKYEGTIFIQFTKMFELTFKGNIFEL